MDDDVIKESAKAARAVAKTVGKGIDAGRAVGGWLNRMGLRGIEWVIFEVKAREKRGLRRDSAFRGMGYLA